MMKWIAAATAVCALVLMAVACVPDYPHDLPTDAQGAPAGDFAARGIPVESGPVRPGTQR